jgi:hypothetical protein
MSADRQGSGRYNALLHGGGLALLLACGSSSAQAETELRASPEQTALALATCTDVMRIKKGFVAFNSCVESLTQTLSNRTQGEILAKSYSDCFGAGRKEGTPEFAACVLDRKAYRNAEWERALSARPSEPAPVTYTKSQSGAMQKSYSESNSQERRQKEEYSCALLGISPGTAGFDSCVAQLDSALRSVEYSD